MWALTGRLGSDDVRRQLDAYRGVGWGVVLYPRWGLEVDYLSDAWFERVRFIVGEAADREMEVWLYDEFCWPSGHARGLVTQAHDELAAELLQVDANGQSRVERVAGSANLLLPEATRRFIALTHERYAAAIGDYFGSCVRAVFTDEPSLALQHAPGHHAGREAGLPAWTLPWSRTLDAALGGDFRQRLAMQSDVERWSGWRDYWAAFADVFHDAWTAPISLWCRAHGLAMTGHFLREDSFGGQVAANGSLRRQLAALDLPGIDEIFTRTKPETCEGVTLSAISELEGRERMAEVFALGPPHMTMGTMKKMVDLCAACGVDRFVMAICPHDLRGSVVRREYCGIYGCQQPWFREFATEFTRHVAEAAVRARQAKSLGVSWPTDEEMWAVSGPDPLRSQELRVRSERVESQAREAIRARLEPGSFSVPLRERKPLDAAWTFEPVGWNCLRLDSLELTIVHMPHTAELSVQMQLVRALSINGIAVDLRDNPSDREFDLSYRRIPVAALLHSGENRFVIETEEPAPLKYLPALILWGDFAVDPQGRIVKAPTALPLGSWRAHGYPEFCGTGRYQTVVDFGTPPPAWLVLSTGGYPASVMVNGQEVGHRAWPLFRFDMRNATRVGSNEITVRVTSTLGHLFARGDAPPVGLLAAWTEPSV